MVVCINWDRYGQKATWPVHKWVRHFGRGPSTMVAFLLLSLSIQPKNGCQLRNRHTQIHARSSKRLRPREVCGAEELAGHAHILAASRCGSSTRVPTALSHVQNPLGAVPKAAGTVLSRVCLFAKCIESSLLTGPWAEF